MIALVNSSIMRDKRLKCASHFIECIHDSIDAQAVCPCCLTQLKA